MGTFEVLSLCIFTLILLPLTSCQPPNIIVLLADDLGWNDVSWHNQAVQMENLNQLSRSGIILDHHYCQPICTPTRGALLTGRYPIHNGLHNGVITPRQPYGLDTTLTLLPQELKRAGYASHIVGKWHLGFCNKDYWPQNRGFDSHYGFLLGAQTYFDHSRDEGYDFRDGEEVAWEANGTYSTYLIQERAKKIISEHDSETPLFLYVPFQAVHGPLEVPEVYRDLYADVEDEDRKTYLGMVTAMDDAVGNITQSLKDSGLYDNSIILWFSDNGGPNGGWPPGHDTAYSASNWPLRGVKYTLWEGGTRTPAMIHSPAHLAQGLTSDLWLHVTDWYPTILAMAGLSPESQDLDGINHWAQLQDPSVPGTREEMVYNAFYSPIFSLWDNSPVAAIRRGDWKYIMRTMGYAGWTPCPPEVCPNSTVAPGIADVKNVLYNVMEDPSETVNLADTNPAIVEDLRSRLEAYIAALPDGFYPPNDPSADPENWGGVWSDGWC